MFELRYRTRSNGFIEPATSHPNEAPSWEQSTYEDYGTEFIFKFTPKPSEKFALNVKVYKGFDEGQRNVHIHLNRNAYYKDVRFSLDLTAYLKAGYVITSAPNLYLHEQDTGDHNLCKTRVFETPVPQTNADPSGKWEWRLARLRRGVIDVVWDIARAQQAQH